MTTKTSLLPLLTPVQRVASFGSSAFKVGRSTFNSRASSFFRHSASGLRHFATTSAALLLVRHLGLHVDDAHTLTTGERFTRSSLGANTSLQSLALEANTNGLRRVELRGYATDNTQALGTVTDAAVKAAIQSAK